MAFKARLLTKLISALAISSSAIAHGAPVAAVPLTKECLQQVSDHYAIHPTILLAVLMVEGGRVGQNSRANVNGSYDIGPFQINTIHLPELGRLGVSETALRNNGCLNAAIAARHLRKVLTPQVLAGVHDEQSYLQALARYHSATPDKNAIYSHKLREAFATLQRHGALQP